MRKRNENAPEARANQLSAEYERMSADAPRERDALEWAENLLPETPDLSHGDVQGATHRAGPSRPGDSPADSGDPV